MDTPSGTRRWQGRALRLLAALVVVAFVGAWALGLQSLPEVATPGTGDDVVPEATTVPEPAATRTARAREEATATDLPEDAETSSSPTDAPVTAEPVAVGETVDSAPTAPKTGDNDGGENRGGGGGGGGHGGGPSSPSTPPPDDPSEEPEEDEVGDLLAPITSEPGGR